MFMCPAYKRPHRLAELAVSWEEMCPKSPLHVRLWTGDPLMGVYEQTIWPDSWKFYRSDAETAGEAIQEFAEMHKGEQIGFIGEDVVLLSPDPINKLETAAGEYFLAYPNDTIQRSGLPTHFCVGPKFIEWLDGQLILPGRQHHFIDTRLSVLGQATGLFRYCPDVIFYHKHPSMRRVAPDSVFVQNEKNFDKSKARFIEYMQNDFKQEAKRMKEYMVKEFEGNVP